MNDIDDCYDNVCKYEDYVVSKCYEEKIFNDFVIGLWSKVGIVKYFYYNVC